MLTNLEKAEKIVREFVEEGFSTDFDPPTFNVYFKWFAEFDCSWKAIAETDLQDGRIYEISFESYEIDTANIHVYESRSEVVVTDVTAYIGGS